MMLNVDFEVKAEKKYESLLKSENIIIVNEALWTNKYDNFIKILNKIDLDNISPKDAINFLYELKEESK